MEKISGYKPFRLLTVLAALMLLTFQPCTVFAQDSVLAETSAAAPAPSVPALILTSASSDYSLARHVRLFEDKEQNLSLQKILGQYQAGGGRMATGNKISLIDSSSAYWLVFSVENRNSSKSQWVLNFGSHADGTVGTANRLAFFAADTPDQPLLIDGRHVKNKLQMQEQERNALPLTLDPGKTATFALYIEPARGLPMIFTPQVQEQATYQNLRDGLRFGNNILLSLVTLFAAGMLMLLFRQKNAIYGLLAAYTSTQFLVYQNGSEIISAGNNTGVVYLDEIYGLSVMSALMLTQQIFFTAREQDKESRLTRLMPVATIAVALVVSLGLAFETAADMTEALLLRLVPLVLPLPIMLLAFMRKDVPQQLTYALSWLVLFAAAAANEFSVITSHVYWLCFALHFALLVFASLRFIGINKERRRRAAAEEALRQEEETEFRKTRELSDQTRLLGVLQREKELITDLRNREAERIQAMRLAKEAAEDANKAKTEFLAIISHEIRTPMTGIMGMIRMLMDTQLDAKQREHISTLKYAGDALLALLNDILDFSKASAGKIELESVNFDLGKLTESVVLLISGRAEEKKIGLKAEIDPATPLFLKGDPTRLRQVLLNLITNAVKFTEKGSVTLIVRMQDKAGGKPRIYFGVKDTGIGIPKEVQKNIFTPYTQANASITRRFGGTGLGLSICLRLVNAMGGDIEIDSEPGVGSTFYFTVPFEEGVPEVEAAPASPAATVAGPAAKPLKILVVDDNPINQKVVAGMLDKDKHKLVAATSARAALDEIKKSDFDVILMDMEMPEIDGPEATRMIRALPDKRQASTPVIAMTANNMKEDIDRCIKAGMNDYCSKPIDLEKLRGQLLQVANKEGPFKPAAASDPPPHVISKPVHIAAPTEATPGLKLELASSSEPAAVPAASSPPAATPVLAVSFNPEVLSGLKKNMGAAELEEMMTDLYQKTEELITAAEKAAEIKDVKALRGRGHDLYGMTSNFGLTAISEPAHKLDVQARENAPIETLAALVAMLRPAYVGTRKAIDEWSAKNP